MKTYRNCILLFLFCLFLYGTFSGLIPLLWNRMNPFMAKGQGDA